MAWRIAVAVADDGNTADIYAATRVIIYQKERDHWTVVQEMPCALQQELGVRHMRQKLAELVSFVANRSQVFVGLTVTGIPYFELEKAGLSVWEFEGLPAEFLDYILDREEEARLVCEQVKPMVVQGPCQTAPGEFVISLKEIQEKNSNITSKQVLQGFVQKGEFAKLEITCNHVPPWLEALVLEKNYRCLKEQMSSKEVRVTLMTPNDAG